MESLKQNDLELSLATEQDQVILTWQGECRSNNPSDFLDPYLNTLIETLAKNSLIVDFRKLEAMNSSTVLPIIRFIKKLEENEIETEIIYSEDSDWQHLLFTPLLDVTKIYKYIKIITK